MNDFELAKELLLDFKKYVLWVHKLAQGSDYDLTESHIKICDKLQERAEGRNIKRNLMINCPPGCLAGDSLISINRCKNGSVITIKELYEKYNGITGHWKKEPVYIRRAINGKVCLSKIEACVYKGVQFTWKIILEDGKELRATGGHKIMTKDGFKKVEDLVIGDLIAVDNKKKVGLNGFRKRTPDKDFVIGKLHPFARYHKSGACYRISYHKAVYEAAINDMSLEEFRKRTYTNVEGMKFVPAGLEIHHIDGNHNNNSPENLEVLDRKAHLLKHNPEKNFGQGIIEYSPVKDILPGEDEPVYDIQCEEIEGQEPNYNANGILVHNTGKSLLLQYFITWCFARSKHCMFCYVAYGERLIKKLSRESRNLMMMPEWEELFGKEMDPGDKSVLNYHLISGGVRSGLTAGTISSAMLGLDAGNPASPDEFYSGDLLLDDINSPEVVSSVHEQIETPEIYQRKLATRRRTPKTGTICIMQRHCFTPETIIWTEDGKKTIKDIVENKYSGKVWSFNPSTQKIELKPIEDYIKNPKSRQEIFNVLGVHCTGQHRVCTQRGVVLARDLKIGDKIISASNALDSSSRSTKFFSKLFLPIICCYYFTNLFFGKISNWFKTVFNNSSNTTVTHSVLNVDDNVVREPIFTDKFLNRCRVVGNFDSKFWGKFSHITNKGKMAILLGIIIVLPISTILKVIKTIIGWIVVKMSNNKTLGSWTNKCFKNKTVCSLYSMVSVFAKRYLGVSHIIRVANKLIANYRIHSTKVRNLVESFITNNISKFFVHTITSLDKQVMDTETYCITVQDNHTLIANEMQGYIFGNCVNDFAGWVMKNEPDEWDFLIIPAIDEEGKSFYEKRYPIEELRRLEKQNPYLFAAMYQQKPIENYGAYFHNEWIRTYRANPEAFDKVFITTDFAFTADGGDYTLFMCWGLAKDKNLYHLRSRMGKWESPDAKKFCVEFFLHCNAAYRQCRRVYVENTLSGIGFIQDMRRECPKMAIIPLRRGAKKNKLNRVESAMTWMEAGRVYFRESDPNFINIRSQFLAYNPSDKNPKDEAIDCCGDACELAFNEKTSSIFV